MSLPLPQTLAFIGGGNMARSLVGGLVARKVDPLRIAVAEPFAETRERMAADFGVRVFDDNAKAVAGAELVVLAVKPQVMRAACESLAAALPRDALLVSVAAGIRTAQLCDWLGGERPVVRVMPNTPALVGAGAAGLFANAAVSGAQRAQAQALLEATGRAEWIADEALMDAVTAVSGSGPAYFFLLVEAMEEAGVAEGLPRETARALVVQTCVGAARMLEAGDAAAGELRRRVTSPGGTTQAAIEAFEAGGFRDLVRQAIAAATRRGQELSGTS
jgi:pyrroline-5-carboxylate reductase